MQVYVTIDVKKRKAEKTVHLGMVQTKVTLPPAEIL